MPLWKKILCIVAFCWAQFIPLLGMVFALISMQTRDAILDYYLVGALVGVGVFGRLIYQFFRTPVSRQALYVVGWIALQLGFVMLGYFIFPK